MININALEKQCPKCFGLGRIENPTWLQFWTMQNDLKDGFQTLTDQAQETSVENADQGQPTEPIFFICRECHGKGKILTAEGKQLIEFVRFWINPNY
ncbi:hypothetical protein [Desulfosporosinus sp. BG]|uniref:hypothetical protein n=1 Tax=Desulfosporosinus sp. BG TaxID=1633135 RepID=UPI00083AF84C|nr:hypothetical protein [Desulfosporosinus sp. BG]ODA42682.1 hypothetical protein DSBG_0556 [Desulfosporosinus sp. BG]